VGPERRSHLAADGRDDVLEFVGLDQDVASLRALGRADYSTRLHQVHQPAGLCKAHPQLALEHRRRPELSRDDMLDGLAEHVEVVADVLIDLPLPAGRGEDVVAVGRLELRLAMLDDRPDLALGDQGSLQPHRL
jgi:hypothetical protein